MEKSMEYEEYLRIRARDYEESEYEAKDVWPDIEEDFDKWLEMDRHYWGF